MHLIIIKYFCDRRDSPTRLLQHYQLLKHLIELILNKKAKILLKITIKIVTINLTIVDEKHAFIPAGGT